MVLGVIATDCVKQVIHEMNFRKDKDIRMLDARSMEQIAQQIEEQQVFTHVLIQPDALREKSGGLLLLVERLRKSTMAEYLVLLDGYPQDSRLVRELEEVGVAAENILFSASLALKQRINELFQNAEEYAFEKAEIEPPPQPKPKKRKSVSSVFSFPNIFPAKNKRPPVHSSSPAQQPISTLESRMLSIQKENLKIAKTIAVAGAGKRIGTTTQALQMLLFLRAHNRKAALIEMHENPCLSSYAQVYSDAVLEKDSCIINGSRLYFSKKALPTIQKEFDFLVLDYGAYRNCAVQELADSDASIIVCGIKPWEAEEINYTFRENNEKYHYLFSFVPQNDQENVTAQMEEFSQRTFFAPYSPDMFQYNGNDELYKALLSDCL